MHNDKIRAAFVDDDVKSSERFKYLFSRYNIKFRGMLLDVKRFIKTNYYNVVRKLELIEWKILFKESSIWVLESLVEGLTANFATHFLFGLKFNIAMILAHGIIIKQSISIYQRLREQQNGTTSKVSESDNTDK